MSVKKSALGKGLGALLSNPETDITSKNNTAGVTSTATLGSITEIPLTSIETNPFQPRTEFEETALLELSESIKEHGIIQPITVRKLGYDKYQLISGERRFRASKLAGLKSVPAYIRVANDQSMLEMALIENIQRENLNPMEVALSYKRLQEECQLTQEALSERMGKNRSTITNFLRLLKLPPEIQSGLRDFKITMGHARALITLEDVAHQIEIFQTILEEGLSVRAVEEVVANYKKGDFLQTEKAEVAEKQSANTFSPSVEIKKIQENLRGRFDSKIELKTDPKGKGKIVIPFTSTDDLNRILDLLH